MPHLRDDRLREHNPEGTRTWAASAAELVSIEPIIWAEQLAEYRQRTYSAEIQELKAKYQALYNGPPRGRSANEPSWLRERIAAAESNTN